MPKLPVQAPEAVHPVVFVEAQVSVAAPPTVTDVGTAWAPVPAWAGKVASGNSWGPPSATRPRSTAAKAQPAAS